MNPFEKVKRKVALKKTVTNKRESQIWGEELINIIDDVSGKECQDIIDAGANYFKSQEKALEKCIPHSGDERRDFSNYLKEAKEKTEELCHLYRQQGFSDQFEWIIKYIDCIAERLFFLTLHIYPNAIQKEDEYTRSGQPADHVVKSLDKETKKWLRDVQEIIDYTYRSIKERDDGKILNGTATFSLIAMTSASLIDKKHGRQFTW